ncbi:MAG: DNA primase [Anaerolineae bacterium]|nr:DNA primase [Anaerolineae bacterium]
MSAADEIKARLDVVDYIQRYVPLKRAGRSYKACCPFHAEKTPSFVVNPDRQSWRCFGQCGIGGDVLSFAMRYHGWSFNEAVQELGRLVGVEVRPQTPEQREESDRLETLRGLMHTAADSYHHALFDPNVTGQAAVLRYAREKRGFTDETLTQFKVGYAPPGWTHMLDHLKTLGYTEEQMIEVGLAIQNEETGRIYDRFRNRLMIPIRDERGRVIGFGARALDPDDNPKYLNSPQTPLFDKSKTLFGLDAARNAIREQGTAVIVEGYMDAIQAHQASFRNVVAQMGTAMTETQLRLLTRSSVAAKRIILALDADAAGQSATRRSLETARQTLQSDWAGRLSVDIRVLQIPGAKDPDDLIRESPERWNELVVAALPVAQYVIDMETAELPPNASVQQREAVARSLLPILAASEDNLYRQDNLQKLALRLRIPERDLLAWAEEQARIDRAKRTQAAPPRRETPAQPPPPDFPPDEFLAEAPPSAAPTRPVAAPSGEMALEIECLRVLFREPMGYYVVNRRLRELARDDEILARGPLADWCDEDFSQPETRAVMGLFAAGMGQDDEDFMEYIQRKAGVVLKPHLDVILADDFSRLQHRLGEGVRADLTSIWTHNRRIIEAADPVAILVEKALRLRIKRLQREREELCFLQIDSQQNGDMDAERHFQDQILLSIRAKGLIEAELQKQLAALRE